MALTGILLQAFGSGWIVISFFANREAITQKYCVNKDKPKMHCNGKCHLMKQLSDKEKKENSPASSPDLKSEIHWIASSATQLVFYRPQTRVLYPSSCYTVAAVSGLPPFHPPRV